jgi:hypothetical protein
MHPDFDAFLRSPAPFAWLLGGLLVLVLCIATAVSIRFLREVERELPLLHAEIGRPGPLYFLTLGWLTPSRFGIWLLTRPASVDTLPASSRRDAALLRRLLLAAFALWAAAVAMVVASWFF